MLLAYKILFVFIQLEMSASVVGVLALEAVDRGFEPHSGQIKDYEICICCFSAKDEILRRKSEVGLTQYNVSVWSNMSTHGLLFQ